PAAGTAGRVGGVGTAEPGSGQRGRWAAGGMVDSTAGPPGTPGPDGTGTAPPGTPGAAGTGAAPPGTPGPARAAGAGAAVGGGQWGNAGSWAVSERGAARTGPGSGRVTSAPGPSARATPG
ncbi:MAG: hypothetical protein M0Z30_09660, partial [Actinomycetota bacterium]|nr:hypothetical protein [Actinomycetota bacterium]